VCLMANGCTTETHFTRWLRPSTNFLIDLYFVGTKDLKKGLAGRTFKSESKSKSIAFKSKSKSESLEPKSKSSKNGLKSGLESKSGLEYYKSAQCKSIIIIKRNVTDRAQLKQAINSF